MIEAFNKFIKEHNLINPEQEILLAISGGIDSVTLFHLLLNSNIKFAIAHCNFCLRGEESDGDQSFVEELARNNNIKCYLKHFETEKYATENKISIQMAARDLRYNWFNEILNENNFSSIAIAHNKNDLVETVLINLVRGTGIRGLSGLKIKNGNIIRPLLFAKRSEIEDFVNSNNYKYREDSSNANTKYLRNAIRHKIIPEFEHLNPSFIDTVWHSSNTLKEAEIVFHEKIETLNEEIIKREDEIVYLNIEQIKNLKLSPYLLFDILLPYGFSFDTAHKILENIDSQPGKIYYSGNYKLIKDRKELILQKLINNDVEEYIISDIESFHNLPIKLNFNKFSIDKQFCIKRNRNIATFDASQIEFPLVLRKWKHGDMFYPFGMKGKKKISDYFTDQKFSAYQKENTWLLISENNVIWVVNHRTDNRYKVTKNTKEIIQIETNN